MSKWPKKLVILADLHAHPWATLARGDGLQNSRLRRTFEVLQASLERARALKAPWLFGGDLVHTAGYTFNIVMAALTDLLSGYPDVLKLAVWGNHDARGVGGRITIQQTVWATLQTAVEGLYVLDPTVATPFGDHTTIYQHAEAYHGLTFSGAGAQPHPRYFTYAAPSDVGLYHGTVRGSTGPNGYEFSEGLDPGELLRRHRIVIVGDIHHPQQIDAPPGQAILIPGSPEHHDFGDVGEHGWWIMTVPATGDPTVEFVPGGSPEFRTVATPADVAADGHFYRVRTVPPGTAVPEGAMVLAPTPTVVPQRDRLHGAHGAQVLQVWMQQQPLAGIDPAQVLAVGQELAVQITRAGQLQPYRLTGLYLHNFCCYTDQAFTPSPGTWLVTGHGRDFPSNGAGKTTLFEALFWLLFGRTSKGMTGDEVIQWGKPGCGVMATFTHADGHELKVARTRGDRSTLEVTDTIDGAWQATSVNDMTDKLGQRLGLTPELFQALGYFSQERVLLFASASDGERKDMLGDLIGLAGYQAASTTAATLAQQAETTVARHTSLADAAQAQREREWGRLQGITEQSAVWRQTRTRRQQEAQAALDTFLATRDTLFATAFADARQTLLRGITERREALLSRRVEVETWLATPRVESTLEQLEAVRQAFTKEMAAVTAAKQLVGVYTGQYNTACDRLRTQEQSLAAGYCPTCRQPVSADHAAQCLRPIRDELSGTVDRLRSAQMEMDRALTAAAELKPLVQAAEAGWATRQQAQAQAGLLKQLTADDVALSREEADLEAVVTQQVERDLERKRESFQQSVTRIAAEFDPFASEEQGIRQRIKEATEGAEAHQQQAQYAREVQAITEYWRHAFSKQGIQSLLVDEVAALFNNTRSRVFPALTQGIYDVQFSTRSQTKAGEWREKTEFQVFEHGAAVPYAALSGGQRRRIDVGVMLTLVLAVAEWMQVPGALGVLILDEVFGFLDASGAEGLAEALREVQQFIPQVYVISHDQQLQALFADVLTVDQSADGTSTLLTGDETHDRNDAPLASPDRDPGDGVRGTGVRAKRRGGSVRVSPKDLKGRSPRSRVDRDPH